MNDPRSIRLFTTFSTEYVEDKRIVARVLTGIYKSVFYFLVEQGMVTIEQSGIGSFTRSWSPVLVLLYEPQRGSSSARLNE